MEGQDRCELCGRLRSLTFHHLIPRSVHRTTWFKRRWTREELNQGINVCLDCHSTIHAFIPSCKELGRRYNTREALLAHPKLSRYVAWVSGRDTAARPRRGRSRRR